jgi:hypothetical protein
MRYIEDQISAVITKLELTEFNIWQVGIVAAREIEVTILVRWDVDF